MRLLKHGLACRARHFLVFILSTVLTTFLLCLFNRQKPVDLQNIVTKTTKHFEHLKENLQAGSSEKRFEVDERVLQNLGFREGRDGAILPKPATTKQDSSSSELRVDLKNQSFPVVVTSAVAPSQLGEVPGFLASVQSLGIFRTHSVVLWNMESGAIGEETEFSLALKDLCNSSRCWVEKFVYQEYPVHVKSLEYKAFRPVIIQTLLDRGGCVLWLDIDRRLLPRPKQFYSGLVNMALNGGSNGIVGWSLGRPTSSLTHPKTFPYFHTGVENYYFHRMIDPAQLLICNTGYVHNKIMLPWVQCALTKDCIDPFGAQSSGCRFDKKPLYRYSGCHGYDSSALNVALGLAFPMHQPYIARSVITQPLNSSPLTQNATAKDNQI